MQQLRMDFVPVNYIPIKCSVSTGSDKAVNIDEDDAIPTDLHWHNSAESY